MPNFLSGPGLGLSLPQNLYPSQLGNAPQDVGTNRVSLQAGDSFVLPAGDWYVEPGPYSVLQFLDPITNTWSVMPTVAWMGGPQHVTSDGFNCRVANLTACPVGAIVVGTANAYVQATTTLTASGGGPIGAASTWAPIVGGAVSQSGATLIANGAGYGVAPLVLIDPPPNSSNNANGVGGIPAYAYAVIASGTVSGVTFTSHGAGYPSAPKAVIVPSPFDPNINSGITAASVNLVTFGGGQITGALCTNSGSPLRTISTFSINIGGAGGTTVTVVPLVMSTVTAATVSGPGVGYGTAALPIVTIGGGPPTTSSYNDPSTILQAFRPRPAQLSFTPANNSISAGSVSVIYDGGLFLHAPGSPPTGMPGASLLLTTVATIALTLSSVTDYAVIQPGP